MQTPAEQHLIKTLKSHLFEHDKEYGNISRILNIGAGRSVVVENQLAKRGFPFVCDRADIEDCQISSHLVGNCYQCSIEFMHPIKSNEYNAAFSNYVLEHVLDLNKAASEIYRVLKPGGIYVTSVPNPTAPESLLSKLTPLWFHKMVRRGDAWETHYAFNNIKSLRTVFQGVGFETVEILSWSFLEGYLGKSIILNQLARLYDRFLNASQFKMIMNNLCITFRKPFDKSEAYKSSFEVLQK